MTTVGGKFTTPKRNLVTYIEHKQYELLRTLASLHGRSVSAEAAVVIQREINNLSQSALARQILEQLEQLPLDLQRQVLQFTQALTLSPPQGIAGSELLRFAGAMEPDDIAAINQAITAGCEGTDSNE